ncbi:MAG: tetratricopeptide repeat protein [Saprospiraceae bacterium]|nr:tetratricopeptide repeat protein [Saprospiraceae bacterium]
MQRLIVLALLTFVAGTIGAQRTTVFTEPNLAFSKGQEFFDQGLYSMAQDEFRKIIHQQLPAQEPRYRIINKKAQLLYAKSAVRLEQPEGKKLMTDFVRTQRPDPTANQALFELANYYYNARDYEEAIEFFSMIQETGLTQDEKAEIGFKHGYCLFVRKRFDEARAKLFEVRDHQGAFYEEANYYYGMTAFYNESYDEALNSWSRIEQAPRYANLMPYYIGQIHARQGNHDALIAFLEPRKEKRGLKNKTEIQHMLGQAYFEKGDFQAALPYLTYYEQHSNRLRAADFYQVALTQYKNGLYEEAGKNFRQLNNEKNEMGQSAMFYLADCFLKQGEKAGARNAFQTVSRMKFDLAQQEEALFHYARLSAEMGLDRDAVKALQRFQPESKYYRESQQLLASTLVNTNDYATAIRLIEKMDEQTPTIKEAYQKVTFKEGLQLYQERKFGRAYDLFQKSLSAPVLPDLQAQANFWIGDMMHQQKQYDKSIQIMERFLTLSRTTGTLPSSSSSAAGHYIQGYNYFKKEDYVAAQEHFEAAVRTASGSQENILQARAVPDAYLRIGDCNFKRGRYAQSSQAYDEAIRRHAPGFEYALYQNAIIAGLTGNNSRKISTLKSLISNHPKSSYADDALYEMARTYQGESRFEEALIPLEQLVSKYRGKSPLINPAYLRMGLIAYNLGRTQDALTYYKTIFKNNPSSTEAKDALAAIEEIYVDDLGQPNEYVAFVESIPGYKVSGDERDALNYSVAERYYERGDYESAVEAFGNYIQSFPRGFNILNAHYYRAESQALLRQYQEALQDYLWVIQQGEGALYARSMGKAALISYNYSEDFGQAFDLYSKWETLTDDPQEKFDAQIGAMRSAYRIGDRASTARYASKVSSSPQATDEERAFARFFEGKLAYDQGQYDIARGHFADVLRHSNNERTAEARYLNADMDFQEGLLDEAEAICRSSFSASGSYPFWVAKSLILLSDILVQKKDLFNAKAALEAMIENFSEDEELLTEANQKIKAIEQLEQQQSRLSTEGSGANQLQLDTGNVNDNE